MYKPSLLFSALLVSACGSVAYERASKNNDCAPMAPRSHRPAPMIATKTAQADNGRARDASNEEYTPTQTRLVKRVADEPLSTFAIDVDTASYAITRRYLKDGQRPPRFAVRVEECLNYFNYGYKAPKDSAFSVQSELVESPFNDKHLLRIGVQGKRLEAKERKAAHLTFLVDVSGSMRSAYKMGLVRDSLAMLVNALEPGDTVALCTYAGNTRVVLRPTPITRKGAILEAIYELDASGSTAMESGLQLAYRCASENLKPGCVNRVIVCSDGDANVGKTHHEDVLKSIEDYKERGITLSTLGFGRGNYKDVMMEQLADKGDGNYSYIDSLAQARRVLQQELMGTLQVIAKDVKIQLEFGAGVESYRLVGYENRDVANEDFRKDDVDGGEIGAGHNVTAVYELSLAKNAEKKSASIGVLRIRAKKPDGHKAEEIEVALAQTPVALDDASPSFKFCAAVLGFAEILRKSPYAREWNLETVARLAKLGRIPSQKDRLEFCELVEKAQRLVTENRS